MMQKWAWPLLGFFVAVCFWGFWNYGPFDLDEGLYAVSLMEMQERGDRVLPTYRGDPFFEKPILFYWTAWIADLCGAPNVVALRLPSILATIGTLTLVGLFSRKIEPILILSVSVLFMGVGRMFMPDPFLMFGMTLTLISFWKAREDARWYPAAGAGLAIAVLAKGPMPVVIFALLGAYARWRMSAVRANRIKPNLLRICGVLLFLAAVLPWYILAANRSSEFVDEFVIKQNLGRLTGSGDTMHLGQFWVYIPIVLVGLLPFSLSIIGAWRDRKSELEHYLWAYIIILFVLFSVAGTKLPHYILPIFPPAAILISLYFERSNNRSKWAYPTLILALLIGTIVWGIMAKDGSPTMQLAAKSCIFALLIGGVASGALCYFKRGGPVLQGFAAIAPLAAAALVFGPQLYWSETHADPTRAAILASSFHLPIVEYRTGGEREPGKTSHPSMQWWIGRNTIASETIDELRVLIKTGGSHIVISRDGRLGTDLRITPLSRDEVTLIESYGGWDVVKIAPSPLTPPYK